MTETENQGRSVQDVFASRRKAQMLISIPLTIIIVALIVGRDEASGVVFGLPLAIVAPVFIVLVLGAVIFSFKNWRCPACNSYLGKALNPRHCHACGVALR